MPQIFSEEMTNWHFGTCRPTSSKMKSSNSWKGQELRADYYLMNPFWDLPHEWFGFTGFNKILPQHILSGSAIQYRTEWKKMDSWSLWCSFCLFCIVVLWHFGRPRQLFLFRFITSSSFSLFTGKLQPWAAYSANFWWKYALQQRTDV